MQNHSPSVSAAASAEGPSSSCQGRRPGCVEGHWKFHLLHLTVGPEQELQELQEKQEVEVELEARSPSASH